MLRILTLNLWNASGSWRERRTEVAAWLDRLEPDLVCLQEVVETPDGRNQARGLAAKAAGEWDLAYGGSPMRPPYDGNFGNAILSRWPVDAVEVVELPQGPAGENGLRRLLLHARTAGLDVFCTHLNWRYDHGYVREAQVARILEAVEALANPASALPPILCGDFNADPEATEIRFLTGRASLGGRSTYFQDAWLVGGGEGPGWTWDRRNPHAAAQFEPNRRIDYVFVGWRRPGGAGYVERAQIACDYPLTGVFASDHFGLIADVITPASWPGGC